MLEFPMGEKQAWVRRFGKGSSLPVIYCLAGDELPGWLPQLQSLVIPALERGLCRPFALTGYRPVDWNRDYTPWPAPALSSKAEAFTGGGPATLQWLQNTWMPEVRRRIPHHPAEHSVLGYSLGGLCALWMVRECSAFSGCACCSGSLWYDGWTDYVRSHGIARPGSRVYLSLGKKEEKTSRHRMAAVGNATRETHARLQKDANVVDTALEWNEGGHFTEIPGRLAKAILWLMKPQP